MVTTARSRVFSYVRDHPNASASQIARALGMSPANARHHLALMVSDGRLASASANGIRRRGRPTKLYRVADSLRGSNLALLSDLLLAALVSGSHHPATTISTLGSSMAGRAEPPRADRVLPKRLSSVIQSLNQMHYDARWEAGATGPRIIFGQCPYGAIIAAHPELCRMDASMLQQLAGATMDQRAKIGEGGSQHCVFAWKRPQRMEPAAGKDV